MLPIVATGKYSSVVSPLTLTTIPSERQKIVQFDDFTSQKQKTSLGISSANSLYSFVVGVKTCVNNI